MFVMPSKFQGKLLLLPMVHLDIEVERIASNEDGGGMMRLVWMRRRTKMLGRLRRG
jgi:hypothetical protein